MLAGSFVLHSIHTQNNIMGTIRSFFGLFHSFSSYFFFFSSISSSSSYSVGHLLQYMYGIKRNRECGRKRSFICIHCAVCSSSLAKFWMKILPRVLIKYINSLSIITLAWFFMPVKKHRPIFLPSFFSYVKLQDLSEFLLHFLR